MKIIKNILFALFLLAAVLFVASCSKDNGQENPLAIEKTVDDLTISTQRVATPISPKLAYSGFEERSWFQLVGDNILYTCASNLGAANPQFMLKYNLTSNAFTPATSNDVVCACGYGNTLVSDNTNAFMITNQARKYSMASDSWSNISFPSAIRDGIGESGMTYANGKIFVCGGRVGTKSFKSYDIASDSWSNRNDCIENLEFTELVTVQNKIYALGGNSIDNKNFSCYDIVTNTWTSKTSLSFEMRSNDFANAVVSVKGRYIFVLELNKIRVYDALKDVWKKDIITVPVSGSAMNIFAQNDTTLLITSVSSSRDFALYKLTLDLP